MPAEDDIGLYSIQGVLRKMGLYVRTPALLAIGKRWPIHGEVLPDPLSNLGYSEPLHLGVSLADQWSSREVQSNHPRGDQAIRLRRVERLGPVPRALDLRV